MSTWLDEILEATKDLESPRSYFFWSALCALSAVVKDKVYLDRGGAYTLYPNIYVILYGDSGLGKGLPIAFTRKLVQAVGNTRVISGRSSIEAILESLGTATSTPRGMIADSAGFIVSSEFSSSIIKNPMAITILTDLYDRIYNVGEWENLLKSGKDKLKNPTVTLLGGVNEEQFKDALSIRDMKGGFIGRTFLIMERKRNTLNPLMKHIETPLNPLNFVEHLSKVSNLKGEFKLTDDAKRVYSEWYFEFYGNEENTEDTGTSSRLRDSVLKVAMLLSLSMDTSLMISDGLLQTAIKICEPLVGSAHKTVMGKGTSSLAGQTATLIQSLLGAENYCMAREKILKKHWKDFDAIDLDRIVLTLTDSNVVIASEEEKGKLYYTLTAEAVESLEKMKQRKRA